MEHELIDIKLIKQKIQHYCAIRDRCQSQVIKKLKDYGANTHQLEDILKELVQHDFLNEERFARTFCSGKFKINKWGKQKIAYELSKLKVPQKIIEIGMSEVNQSEYISRIAELSEKKYKLVKDSNSYIRKKKVVNYLVGKGYETNLVWAFVNQL